MGLGGDLFSLTWLPLQRVTDNSAHTSQKAQKGKGQERGTTSCFGVPPLIFKLED